MIDHLQNTRTVFIGSSQEGLEIAERIAALLEDVPGMKSRLWKDEFRSGDITLIRIEDVASEVAGALMILTPDDETTIRGERAWSPRANVIFEFAFFLASLGRHRVALCRYDGVRLPSDIEGLTHIPMGNWHKAAEIEANAKIRMKDWARKLSPDSASQLRAAITRYETRLHELRQTYRDVLDGKVEQSLRAISYQLEIIDERVRQAAEAGRPSEISILGINATGPLHQGREILIRVLAGGGKIRLLLLDPEARAFEERCLHEFDRVGRIAAELTASLRILMDILSQAPAKPDAVEVRLYDQSPDRSLLMIDAESPDGIVMENPYPELKGKRGLEGQMYPLVQRGRTARGYRENVANFDRLWASARRVTVDGENDDKRKRWPYSPA